MCLLVVAFFSITEKNTLVETKE